ncbi:MAG: hypothetical protein AABZ60_01015 [Planctomycetota bacterium]
MTSINALKITANSGVMVCDEQRGWNDDRLKIYCSDKILPLLSPELSKRYKLAVAYGNTGSSTIGDEIRQTLKRAITQQYEKQVALLGHPPETFLNLEDLARLTFQVICDIKRDHIDESLKHSYGFTTQDLIRGQYEKKGEMVSLETQEVIEEALKRIGPSGDPAKHNVLNNAGILAGYDASNGFQIFMFSMREYYYEPIYSNFACLGSGSDTANFVMANFFNQRSLQERAQGLDSARALRQLLTAVATASQTNIGVGGYMNIIIFNGPTSQSSGELIEVNDHRSKLVLEAVLALGEHFFAEEAVQDLIKGLLFEQKDLAWGEELFWGKAKHPQNLHRFLRGYPEEFWKQKKL